MNDYINQINNRVSVRDFIPNQQIPKETIVEIIGTAQKASTSFNLQTYCALSITDKELRKQIAELSENQDFIIDASDFIVVCTDLHKIDLINQMTRRTYYQERYFESTLMGIIDATLFGQALASAAESRGLGICFVGGIRGNIEKIDTMLKLPQKVFPLFGLAIGYPKRRNPQKPRLPIPGIFFENEYDSNCVAQAIKDYDFLMIDRKQYNGRQYKIEEFGSINPEEYGWVEHSSRRTSTRDINKIRENLETYIRSKGLKT